MATDPEAVFETAVQLIVLGIMLWVFGKIFLTLLPTLLESGVFDTILNVGWKVVALVVLAFVVAWWLESGSSR